MPADLMLDSQIRWWVFLPTVLITFLFGIVRHYIIVLSTNAKPVDLQHFHNVQVLIKARILRENFQYITEDAFQERRMAFNKPDGFLTEPINRATTANPMADPTVIVEQLKNNLTNVLPTILIGGWINWMFSGFVTTKLPFPLTLRFKLMLQREIDLNQLDACWVSSASWYFLNVFGLTSIHTLILNVDHHDEQVTCEKLNFNETKMRFKAEWEALEIVEHCWFLSDAEADMI